MTTLEIKDLHVSISPNEGEAIEILKGVNLTVNSWETHAVMGPNGSGKSTLSYAIAAGRLAYVHVVSGALNLNGQVLQAGDGAKIADETDLRFQADEAAEILLFDLPPNV